MGQKLRNVVVKRGVHFIFEIKFLRNKTITNILGIRINSVSKTLHSFTKTSSYNYSYLTPFIYFPLKYCQSI